MSGKVETKKKGVATYVINVKVFRLANRPLDVIVASILSRRALARLASKGGALGERRCAALGVLAHVAVGLGGGNDLVVAVVLGVGDIRLVLQRRIVPAVVDAQCDKVDLLTGIGAVLAFEVAGELRAVVSTIAGVSD